MPKYNEQFILGYDLLAKKYGITSNTPIRTWVKLYEKFGVEGLKRKQNKEVYSVQFKLDVLRFMERTGSSVMENAFNLG